MVPGMVFIKLLVKIFIVNIPVLTSMETNK